MKLSMWILKYWLSDYSITASISQGDMVLTSARLFEEGGQREMERSTVYVGPSQDFIGQTPGSVICVHGQDLIRINGSPEISQVFNDILRAFDYFGSWESDLFSAAEKGGPLKPLLDMSQDVFKSPLFIADEYLNVVAMSSGYPAGTINDEWDYMAKTKAISLKTAGVKKDHPRLMQAVALAKEPTLLYYDIFDYYAVCCTLIRDGHKVGNYYIIEHETPLEEAHLQLSKIFLQAVMMCLDKQPTKSALKSYATLFEKILNEDHINEEELSQSLTLLEWARDDEYQLFRIVNSNHAHDDSSAANRLINLLNQQISHIFAFLHWGDVILILNKSKNSSDSLYSVLGELLLAGGFYCGKSLPLSGILSLASGLFQADTAIKLGGPQAGTINSCSDFAWDYLVNQFIATAAPLKLVHPGWDVLRRYDGEHGTQFEKTLYIFLQNERNIAKTAKAMFLHRNTLLYRIQRIKSLLGTDLSDTKERDYLYFSYYLCRFTAEKQS